MSAAVAALSLGDDQPPLTVDRGPGRGAAERELSKPMYHQDDPNLFQRALDRFWDWVSDLFGAAAGATPGGAVGLFVIVLLLLLLVGALWWRLGTPRRLPSASATLFDDRPRSAAQHRAAAEAHAAKAHWTAAVQERMRAVVRSLEERAILDPRPGRTADEAAAEAAHALPSHTASLRSAAEEFDAVTYGGRSADETAYRRMAALDNALEQSKPLLDATARTVG
ncbi:DUF4129 domain-containing protein [Streptomyces tsukubensis]|nr:DUF4129 domain-containing protein [Streptomyces tsukubensis]